MAFKKAPVGQGRLLPIEEHKRVLTHSVLLQLLDYDPQTGIFRWRERSEEHFASRANQNVWNAKYAGKIAGTPCRGYIRMVVASGATSGQRLAWFYVHGEWPPHNVDHINRDPSDNRIKNLRLATNAQNQWNRPKLCYSTSPYKGVTLHKPSGRWSAKITKNKERIYLGYYSTPEEAAAAYRKAAIEHHGEYARPD